MCPVRRRFGKWSSKDAPHDPLRRLSPDPVKMLFAHHTERVTGGPLPDVNEVEGAIRR